MSISDRQNENQSVLIQIFTIFESWKFSIDMDEYQLANF